MNNIFIGDIIMKKIKLLSSLLLTGTLAIISTVAVSACSAVSPISNFTYEELKNLRDSNSLTPGQKYRLTDYQATVGRDPITIKLCDAQPAPKQLEFDLILTALSNKSFSENVSVDAKSNYRGKTNFNAWTVKYNFDNNKDIYTWADEENGKGVIYYMKDEFNNECPYDFKNIQLLAGEVFKGETYDDWFPDDIYRYTFSSQSGNQEDEYDLSIDPENNVHDNVIKPWWDASEAHGYVLNKIVFGGVDTVKPPMFDHPGIFGNDFDTDAHNIITGVNCVHNTIGSSSQIIRFADAVSYLTIGKYCGELRIGNLTHNTRFGDFDIGIYAEGGFSYNTIGNWCYDWEVDGGCSGNTFDDYVWSLILEDECAFNYLGTACGFTDEEEEEDIPIILHSQCTSNTFGERCCAITLGGLHEDGVWYGYCSGNTFSDECYKIQLGCASEGNAFGSRCKEIILGDKAYYNTFGANCSYIKMATNYEVQTTIDPAYVKYNQFVAGCFNINVKFDQAEYVHPGEGYYFTDNIFNSCSGLTFDYATCSEGYTNHVWQNGKDVTPEIAKIPMKYQKLFYSIFG